MNLVPKEVSAKRATLVRRDNTMRREDSFAKRQPRRKAFRISDIILMNRLRSGSGTWINPAADDDEPTPCWGF